MESIRENNVNIHSKKFAKKITGKHRTSSDVSADPFYSESNIRYLNGIANDIKTGKAHFSKHELLEDDKK